MKFCDEIIQKHLLNGGKIKKTGNVGIVNCPIMFKNCLLEFANGGKYPFSILDLTVDTWEIVEPEYDWDEIIKDKILCVFWDDFEYKENPTVGCLTKKTAEGFFKSECDFSWKCCKPFNPADFNIAKDLKEYEK